MNALGLFSLSLGIALAAGAESTGWSGIVSVGEKGEFRAILKGALEEVKLKPNETTTESQGNRSPIRIISCNEEKAAQHEGGRVWTIRYSAWMGGDYDLRDYLEWPEGVTREMVPRMIVSVVDPLDVGHQGELAPLSRPIPNLPMPPSAPWRVGVVAIWAAVLAVLGWMAWIRKNPLVGAMDRAIDPIRRTLLEGIRVGARGALTPQTRAELQRQFLGLLLREFAGTGGSMRENLTRIEEHPQGAPLMREFDEWLERTKIGPMRAPKEVVRYLGGGSAKTMDA